MWGGSRQAIEENLLGDNIFLGDRGQVAKVDLQLLTFVEYLRLVFGLGFYHLGLRDSVPFM